LTAGYQVLDQTDEQPYSDYHYQPARDRVPPSGRKNSGVATEAYQPYCDAPQSRDDADLCSQWASAQAATESNRLSRISIRITGFEFGALIVSLIFTGWAAFAASKATKIAQDANDGANEAVDAALRSADATKLAAQAAAEHVKAFERAERAHLILRPIAGNFTEGNESITINIIATNFGRSTAYVERLDWSGLQDEAFPETFEETKALAHPIKMDESRTVDATIPFKSNFIGCRINYRTVFNRMEYAYFLGAVQFAEEAGFLTSYTHIVELVIDGSWPENS